ncbi:MAG: ABC transporter permease, partial [candidate division WOR-3 bacterium]|nr:ABC transporter permease [candidate division WOR-3 bacterium]
LLLSFLSSLLAGLGACMLLGAFTKDSKTSQTMIFPITISAMFSMFMTMFIDFSTMAPVLKVIYFMIPFSHPMMAFRELLFGNYMLVVSGIVYCFAFFFIMIGITARIFSSDVLLIGLPEKFKLTKYLKSR